MEVLTRISKNTGACVRSAVPCSNANARARASAGSSPCVIIRDRGPLPLPRAPAAGKLPLVPFARDLSRRGGLTTLPCASKLIPSTVDSVHLSLHLYPSLQSHLCPFPRYRSDGERWTGCDVLTDVFLERESLGHKMVTDAPVLIYNPIHPVYNVSHGCTLL